MVVNVATNVLSTSIDFCEFLQLWCEKIETNELTFLEHSSPWENLDNLHEPLTACSYQISSTAWLFG